MTTRILSPTRARRSLQSPTRKKKNNCREENLKPPLVVWVCSERKGKNDVSDK